MGKNEITKIISILEFWENAKSVFWTKCRALAPKKIR